MTTQQLKWCKAHDWCMSTDGDAPIVRDTVYDRATKEHTTTVYRWAGTFAELRVWAGY